MANQDCYCFVTYFLIIVLLIFFFITDVPAINLDTNNIRWNISVACSADLGEKAETLGLLSKPR